MCYFCEWIVGVSLRACKQDTLRMENVRDYRVRAYTHSPLSISVCFLCIHGQHQVENGENAIRSVENDGIYDNPFRSDVVVGL